MINNKVTCMGKHVNMRTIRKFDSKIFMSWDDLDEKNRYFPNNNFIDEIKNEFWIDRKLADKNGIYLMIEDSKTNSSIGITIIENIDLENSIANWGIYIAKRDFMKKIYVNEAAYLILNYAFENLNLNKINACALSNNKIGRKFHNDLGFIEEAIFNNQVLIDGYYCDLIWASLTKNDFKNIKKPPFS